MSEQTAGRKGNRLSKIVTRTGDKGETGLGDGSRIGKDSRRIDAIGEVDELNSLLGVLLTEDMPDRLRGALVSIQHDLFDLGGELCLPGMEVMKTEQVGRLEALVEEFNADLPRLKEFILPGGTKAAALAHLARTVCRRAERSVVRLGAEEAASPAEAHPVGNAAPAGSPAVQPGVAATHAIGPIPRQYLNRLSDLLFIFGRVLNRAGGQGDVLWEKGKNAAG